MGALLMLAPLVAVPILAVVGIPQFAPGNLIDLTGSKAAQSSSDGRAFAEPRFGDAARHEADDLFAPLEDSAADIDGFDDPLASRKSKKRVRNSGRDVDSQFDEEPARPREKQSSPFEDSPDDEFAESSAENLNSGDVEEDADTRPRNRRRPSEKISADEFEEVVSDAQLFHEADAASSPEAQSPGERFADAASSRVSDSKQTNPAPGSDSQRQTRPGNVADNTDEANPFEAAAVENQPRPTLQKKAPARPRDPRDAPVFQPVEPAPVADEASFAATPGSKALNTGRRSPPPVVPPAPPELVAQLETATTVGNEEQVPGVDELTWQHATKRLRALGVGKSKQYFTYLEDRDSFLFTCVAIHAKDSKKAPVRFEAEAEAPLLAVSQVLEKLESWQSAPLPRRTVSREQE